MASTVQEKEGKHSAKNKKKTSETGSLGSLIFYKAQPFLIVLHQGIEAMPTAHGNAYVLKHNVE